LHNNHLFLQNPVSHGRFQLVIVGIGSGSAGFDSQRLLDVFNQVSQNLVVSEVTRVDRSLVG
jgi:hypothetical protein